jgi:hypothetical protein
MSGIAYNVDVLKTVDVARQMRPQARKILLISGASTIEHIYLDQFQQGLET